MSVFTVVFFLFFLFYIFYSFYIARRGVALGDYMVMKREVGPFLVCGAYAAGLVSAVGMIGISGLSYQRGFLTGVLQWGMFTGYILTAYLIGHRLRRLPRITVADFLADRFASPALRVIAAIITIFGVGFYFMSQLTGSGVILEVALGIPYDYIIILMAVAYIIVAMTAGAKSVTVLDTVMWVVIVVTLGIFFSPVLIAKVGMENIRAYQQVNPNFFTFNGGYFTLGTMIGWQILWAFGGAANPTLISRCYLAKDAQTWTKAITLALPMTLLTVWLTHFAAGAVHVVKPDLKVAGQALTWAGMNITPHFIGALAIAGLFAAVLSTAATQLLYMGQTIGNDIYHRLMKKDQPINENIVLWVTRVAILIMGLIAIPICMGKANWVNQFGNIGTSIIAATFFPALVAGLYVKNATKAATIAAMAVGGTIVVVLYGVCLGAGLPFGVFSLLPGGIHPVIWGVVGSFIVLYCVSAFDKPTSEQLEIYKVVSNVPEEDKPTPEKTKSFRQWNYGLLIYTVVQTVVLFALAAYLG